MTANVETLKKYLDKLDGKIPVKVYCSYNQYDIKRIVLYEDNLILEVGDVENPAEEFQNDGPLTA